MRARQATLVGLILTVGFSIGIAPVIGVGNTTTDPTVSTASTASVQANETNNASEASLGAKLSSFMQASSAEADGSVESGMWAAEFNSPESNRPELVQKRVGKLDRKLNRLRDRMQALKNARDNGTLPDPAYFAQASQLTAQTETLADRINQTDAKATELGINDSRLDTLRQEARNISGQEVAREARSLSVVTPPGLTDDFPGSAGTAGPPDDVGPGENGPPDNVGPGKNGTSKNNSRPGNNGPPDDAGPGNNGPPDDAGSGNNGPPDDAGSGNNGPPDDAGPGNNGSPDDAGSGNNGPPDDAGPGNNGPPDDAESDSDSSDSSDESSGSDDESSSPAGSGGPP